MESHLSGVWIVAIAFYGLAIYTFITSKPMNFWAGHKISSHRIKNPAALRTKQGRASCQRLSHNVIITP